MWRPTDCNHTTPAVKRTLLLLVTASLLMTSCESRPYMKRGIYTTTHYDWWFAPQVPRSWRSDPPKRSNREKP